MQNNDIYAERLTAVRAKFEEWQVDGLLVGNDANRRWLSGFAGSSGQLLVTHEQAVLATDFRYWEQAPAQAPQFTLFKHQRRDEDTAAFINSSGVAKIGLEGNHVTLLELSRLKKVKGVKWVSLAETVEPLRAVKDAPEIAAIRAAAAVADHTMSRVAQLARPGMSERQLAWELEKVMREAGAEATAFTVIVASGPNGALPHHHPGERGLQHGDALVVDLGAQIDGYKSDLTRTFYLGDEPDEQFWSVYDLVLAAQTAVFENAKPGMASKEIDALARDCIAAVGHGDHFGHGLGHGVGLDIHEAPHLSFLTEKETVIAGMVVTVEPGIYLPGWGGVRLEDLGHVTATGIERLSFCPKSPIVPGF